jgi:phytoene/squalene synthetase
VINHLQDCKEDFLKMGRIYIPADWMAAYGVSVESINQPNLSDSLSQVLDKVILAIAELMLEAYKLPYGLYNRRLAMESQVIINVADSLIAQLRAKDPLVERVKLTKSAYVWCVARGITGYFAPRNPY